jgi:hypothetical protein
MDTNTTDDEHDLVKALDGAVAGLGGNSSDPTSPTPSDSGLPYEETSSFGSEPVVLPGSPVAPAPTPSIIPDHPSTSPLSDTPTPPLADTPPAGPLDDIKKDALTELRPLVDKLSVSPEEKFDTYLLLIRSTDDTALIAPAHEAAKAIPDETRRAQALLDIIKEIDYLSHPKNDQ